MMRVLIMADQEALECQPFTVDRPPALLRVLDKTVLEHNLNSLAGSVGEISIVAGDWEELIRSEVGEEYAGMRLVYEQGRADGSNESGTIVLRGDTLYADSLAETLSDNVDEIDKGAIAIRYPWNLLEANVAMVRGIKDRRKGHIEDGVFIKGEVDIGEGTLIKSGCYIEGPAYIGRNAVIGPFAHIRPDTIIESECEIGKSELYDCLIMRATTCKHQAYIGHSVVGRNVNIGAGLITADYRHDAGEHTTIVEGEKVATGRRKLGAFIGDGVHTGIGTLIYPGRKIWPRLGTLPGEIVMKDKRSS